MKKLKQSKLSHEFNLGVYCQVMRDPKTDAPRGWGVVEFSDSRDAAKCVRKLRGGRTFCNKTVRAEYYLEDPSKRPGKVFVQSSSRVQSSSQSSTSEFLRVPLDEQILRNYFGRIGVVNSVHMNGYYSAYVTMARKSKTCIRLPWK